MANFVYTKVDPDRLSTTAKNTGENITRINNALAAIETALSGGGSSGSLAATWSGPASRQFFAQYQQDKKTITSHMKVLTSLNDQLQEAAGLFDSADASALDMVNKLKIG